MNVHQTLICFFLLSLQDGNKHLIGAENRIITEKEGGNIRHACTFRLSGKRRIFCREKCEDKKYILIDTTKVRDENGRYSIEYSEGTFLLSSTVLYVSITNLTKSDSGQYRCGLNRWFLDSSEDFEVKVEDAPITSTPKLIPQPFSPSLPSASTPTPTITTTTTTQSLSSSSGSSSPSSASTPTTTTPTTTTTITTAQSLSSSSGSSSPSSASTKDTKQPQQQQTAGGPDVLLYVGLTLVVMVIMFSVAVLIFCRKRTRKPRDHTLETVSADVTQADRVYEDIREEDRQKGSPVEISTVYTSAKYTKPNAVETTDDYSLVTAAGPQDKAEDDPSKLTYSEVDFSNSAASSLSSAPRGVADNVIYSVPRVEASSNGSPAEGASAPLYSTVSLPQQ